MSSSLPRAVAHLRRHRRTHLRSLPPSQAPQLGFLSPSRGQSPLSRDPSPAPSTYLHRRTAVDLVRAQSNQAAADLLSPSLRCRRRQQTQTTPCLLLRRQ
ncbi:hypothetical protein M0R45_034633 [Rubus argutus]|uniref:Uncharacterized protein n=1 Tax=Rubus argutus TaxID=59490 RepID=A0AAW1VRQ1_RUBAR